MVHPPPVTRTMKMAALTCLCVQNSSLILLMRYSRSVLKETYLSSSAVVMMELTKLFISAGMVMNEGGTVADLFLILRRSFLMCVPSLLYVIQNSLQFLAIKHLEASSFSILAQLKILTTAICSVIMLGTILSARQWRALMLLVVGAILVQYPEQSTVEKNSGDAQRSSFIGIAAVLGMVCLSGFAGIFLEKYLKSDPSSGRQPSIWERNLQLSFWGIIFGLLSVATTDAVAVYDNGFFSGFSVVTWAVVILAAAGGLIVAVVVKYTNTIIKGFATSLSIVLTSLVSLMIFDVHLGVLFWLGTTCVLLSIFNYNEENTPVKPVLIVPE